ncbi:MAG TPA: hypothetical protein VF677_11130 [Flavobacterium sp.]
MIQTHTKPLDGTAALKWFERILVFLKLIAMESIPELLIQKFD